MNNFKTSLSIPGEFEVNKTNSIEFQLNEFEGPLDLLLYLIQKAELNIYDIPIADITEQYLNYLKQAKIDMNTSSDMAKDATGQSLLKNRLEDLTKFHVMSATLLQIKSRMLLPKSYFSDDEYIDPRKEIIDQLIEYQKFKRLSHELLKLSSVDSFGFIQREERQLYCFEHFGMLETTNLPIKDLRITLENILADITSDKIIDLFEEFTVNDKITLLSEKISLHEIVGFKDLIFTFSALEIICSFWAVLEFAKSHVLTIIQEKPFSLITLKPFNTAKQEL